MVNAWFSPPVELSRWRSGQGDDASGAGCDVAHMSIDHAQMALLESCLPSGSSRSRLGQEQKDSMRQACRDTALAQDRTRA